MTLSNGWKWPLWAQMATVVMAVQMVLIIPSFQVFKYYIKTQINNCIQEAVDCQRDEHDRIKSSIIKHHPEEVYYLYPVRSGNAPIHKIK